LRMLSKRVSTGEVVESIASGGGYSVSPRFLDGGQRLSELA